MNQRTRWGVAGGAAVAVAAYACLVRPWHLRWGATDAERAHGMPSDALRSQPTFLSTRAITIDATSEMIWPRVLQTGYGSAGFYGYDIIENLGSARGIHSAERIVPKLQHIVIGDPLPPSAAGGLVVHAITPTRFIVWSGESGTYTGGFTWALYPAHSNHTRLVSRIQWSHHWTQPLMLAMDLFTEFADHVAVKKVLQGRLNTKYRIRQGDHRILYEIVDATLVVTVVLLGNRREVYRS